jgi:hypothetical protein
MAQHFCNGVQCFREFHEFCLGVRMLVCMHPVSGVICLLTYP